MSDDAHAVLCEVIRAVVRGELARVGLRPAPPAGGGWIWDDVAATWMPLVSCTPREDQDAGTGTGLTVL